MVGAVLFLPDNAFAEKNELSGQQNSQKASGQVKPSVEIDNAAVKPNVPANGKALVVLDPTMKNQGGVKQQPSEVSTNKPTAGLGKNAPTPNLKIASYALHNKFK